MQSILEYIKKTKSSDYNYGEISEDLDMFTFEQMLKDNGFVYNKPAGNIYNTDKCSRQFIKTMKDKKSWTQFTMSNDVSPYHYYLYPGTGSNVLHVVFNKFMKLKTFDAVNPLGIVLYVLYPNNPGDIEEMNILLGLK